MLVTWAVTLEGRKVLLGLQLGSRESYENWLDFGRDLLARGMRPPALIVADDAAGLWNAARGETSALCVIWAVLELSSRGWRGVVMTSRAVAEIERLRRARTDETPARPTEEVIAA